MRLSIKYFVFFSYFYLFSLTVFALEPKEVLVIYNKQNPDSQKIALHYADQRSIPFKNIMPLKLDASLNDSISREAYKMLIAEPIENRLKAFDPTENIRCLLLTYGIPYKLEPKYLSVSEKRLADKLEENVKYLIEEVKEILAKMNAHRGPKPAIYDKTKEISRHKIVKHTSEKVRAAKSDIEKIQNKSIKKSYIETFTEFYKRLYDENGLIIKIIQANKKLNQITGDETNASVDSELSMVKYSGYPLYRWQPNRLRGNSFAIDLTTVMVSRLDGPDVNKVLAIVNKSIRAEENGLKGIAYFDLRGLKEDKQFGSFGYFDRSLRKASELTRDNGFKTVTENTSQLFQPDQCSDTALYCGWYSLKKYIPAFEYNDGAVGYHIASWEAVNLRDPNSSQWCPAMIKAGITATLGAVSEPYLHSFPEPDKFFAELFKGYSVVEAYYKTKPFNSWQLVLIADPLYAPFKN